jgi:ABC-2 type transport system permease protein
VAAPGDSPFKSRPGNNLATMLTQFAGFGGLGLLVLPELVLVIVALATRQPLLAWIALPVGLLLGAVVLVLGIRTGGRVYDRRAPELLLALTKDA